MLGFKNLEESIINIKILQNTCSTKLRVTWPWLLFGVVCHQVVQFVDYESSLTPVGSKPAEDSGFSHVGSSSTGLQNVSGSIQVPTCSWSNAQIRNFFLKQSKLEKLLYITFKVLLQLEMQENSYLNTNNDMCSGYS